MKRLMLGGAFALFALAGSAFAQDDMSERSVQDFEVNDAGDLLELCDVDGSRTYPNEAIHFCHGVLVGAYRVHEALVPDLGRIVCPPDGTTREDGVAIFVDWAKAHPGKLTEPAIEVLFESWVLAYPCAE